MLIEINELSWKLLEKYPVWTWHEGTLFEPENIIKPVNNFDNLQQNYDSLFIKAYINIANGQKHKGTVSIDTSFWNVYELEIFLEDGRSFGFNKTLKGMTDRELYNLVTAINVNSEDIFPVTYECDLDVSECALDIDFKKIIIGQFNPFE